MKLEYIKEKIEDLYDVVIASKIGRFADIKGVPYDEAKQQLNRMVGDYQSDIFPEDPLATMEWKNKGHGAIITTHTGHKIFFYMVKVKR